MGNSNPILPAPVKWSSVCIGGGALVYFFIFLIGHTRVCFDLGLSIPKALLMDLGLSTLFFCQHSIMVRQSFKQQVSKWLPPHWFAAVFSISSGATLILTLFLWQGAGDILVRIPFWIKIIQAVCVLLSVAGFLWGVYSLSGFNPFGIQPNEKNLETRPVLKIQGAYKKTRHPLYFFSLVLIWSTTTVTIDRLMFNLIWSGWIFWGAWLEEKDLVDLFGTDYQDYQKQTPMIIPIKSKKVV